MKIGGIFIDLYLKIHSIIPILKNMHTISLSLLISQLQAAQARGVLFTNVENIECYGNTVSFDAELSESDSARIIELEEEIERLKDDVRSESEAANAAAEENRALEDSVCELERELSSIKDDTGTSITEYKRRAEEAGKEVALARQRVMEWKGEIDALRKRKGVIANYFKIQEDVIKFLASSKNAGNETAAEILRKLHENSCHLCISNVVRC